MDRKIWRKKYQIDPRSAADIEKRIAELAESYDTGWHYNPEEPDIGTALAKIFATQMEENIGQENDVLARYHTEFINLLDISLLPAKPAGSIVVASLIDDTLPGAFLEKGTQLLSEGENGVIFEADHSIYVTGSRIEAAFLTDAETGDIVPVLGRFGRTELPGEYYSVPAEESGEEEEEPEGEEENDAPFPFLHLAEEEREENPGLQPQEEVVERLPEFTPFTLFGEHDGIGRNALILYHPTVFDVENDSIYLHLKGAPQLVRDIEEERVFIGYASDRGIRGVKKLTLMPDGETFRLEKSRPCLKIAVNEKEYSVFFLFAAGIVEEARKVERIGLSSSGKPTPAENVSDGLNDFDPASFTPFSDTLALYAQCYIGHNGCFTKAGARIQMTFELTFKEHRLSMTAEQIDESLKIIKKKPKVIVREVSADAFADEVALEYYNGTGWKKLPLENDIRALFASDKATRITLNFECPADWEDFSAGAFTGRLLRLQVLKADNCYLRPSIHHYPVISNLLISYEYAADYTGPAMLEMVSGTKKLDLSSKLKKTDGFTVFKPGEYHEDALYLGFGKSLENGPISLLFELEESSSFDELKCRFEYMTADGFRPLKVSDQTQDFTRSGVIRFMPPTNMKKKQLEGKEAYWLRVVRGKRNDPEEGGEYLPKVKNILLNAVSVSNIETLAPMDMYVENLEPNMRFALGITNILDAEVWVNELDNFTRGEMQELLGREPERVFAEYDSLGNFSAFFVRWEEVPNFSAADTPRAYLLDRLHNQLIFGDGVNTWFPRVTDNTAMRVRLRRSAGDLGNVGVGEITDSMAYLTYMGTIYNPIRAYGGSNIENIDEALQRGSNLLSSGGRLVSLQDYQRAIRSYSDTIDQVQGVTGMVLNDADNESDLYFVILMKEYADGSFAFHQIAGGLKKFLLKHSEVTVTEERLHLVEPVFVEISVEVWTSILDMDDSFELQPMMEAVLADFLNPIGYESGLGWRIGTLPKKSQLLMRINTLKTKAMIKKSMVNVRYHDSKGIHEEDLDDVAVTPFMLPVSGNHRVHIMY